MMSHDPPWHPPPPAPQPPTASCASPPRIDQSEILAILKELKDSMNNMKEVICSLPSKLVFANKDGCHWVDVHTNEKHDNTEVLDESDPEHIDTVCVEIVNNNEDSIASADEAVPEIPCPRSELN